jgi:hypothetical protein
VVLLCVILNVEVETVPTRHPNDPAGGRTIRADDGSVVVEAHSADDCNSYLGNMVTWECGRPATTLIQPKPNPAVVASALRTLTTMGKTDSAPEHCVSCITPDMLVAIEQQACDRGPWHHSLPLECSSGTLALLSR